MTQPRDRTVSGGPVEVTGYAAVKGTRIDIDTVSSSGEDTDSLMGLFGLYDDDGWQVMPVRVRLMAPTPARLKRAARTTPSTTRRT